MNDKFFIIKVAHIFFLVYPDIGFPVYLRKDLLDAAVVKKLVHSIFVSLLVGKS